MGHRYHLAQLNIGRMKAPPEDPMIAGFMARLDDVNALADAAPGFVWRLQTNDGNATAIRPYPEDALLLVNMSVWKSPEDLRNFVYRSDHVNVMRQRRSWFEKFDGMYYVLWWVPAGHIPTIEEAKARLAHLQTHGETAHAFSFARLFPAPGETGDAVRDFSDPCPAL
jgi:hypothetical protein